MQYETIDTHEAMNLFRALMKRESEFRLLRLVGDANMGKSHLLTKVFPTLAPIEFQTRYATLDLRNRMYEVPEILDMACNSIGMEHCENYSAVRQKWISQSMNQTRVEVHGIRAFFSSFRIALKESADNTYYRDLDLASHFIKDVTKMNDRLLLLLFDSANSTSEHMQAWLMDTFLVKLLSFPHVRIVIAGRSLPDVNGSYATLCRSYQLRPVTDIKEYMLYCQRVNANLVEQSIQDFAHGCYYTPGTFVGLVYPFLKQG